MLSLPLAAVYDRRENFAGRFLYSSAVIDRRYRRSYFSSMLLGFA
jgi:hypothetical protein